MEGVQIAFTGDTCFSGNYHERLRQGLPVFSASVQQKLLSLDFVVTNLEGALCHDLSPVKPGIVLANPPEAVHALASNNIQVFNLANNHIMDFGNAGLLQTFSILNKKQLPHFGAGKNAAEASQPVYLEKNGVTVALIGCAHKEGMMASENEPGVFYVGHHKLLRQQAEQARQSADWVVLNYHGGEEFTRFPQPTRRRLLRKLLQLPVDFIVAHHPHVVQGVEEFNGKYIFWSLGNFIFHLAEHQNLQYVNQGMLPIFHFSKTQFKFHILPLILNIEKGIVEEGDASQFRAVLEELSDFSDYGKKWRKEASRVFWAKRNKRSLGETEGEGAKGNKGLLQKAKTAVRWLRDENQRPLVMGAIKEALYKKLRN
ncbi:MAG: CapA family protein [Bacteroidia bacterium]